MNLPFPLWVVGLGVLGSVSLVLGLIGALGSAEGTLLAEPGLYIFLLVLGGILLVAESVGLVFFLRQRSGHAKD
ncbi:MAG: hypothetical protein R3200_02430 [Xanthomonadales bacterium]|nr:hypothetical protein [Xanthomonadales bacterium]